MKRSILAATASIAALSAFVSVNAAREAADREAVEKPLKMYLSGEPAQLRQAFHPGATMFFARNDSLIAVPIPEYIARVEESRAKGPPPKRVERIAQGARVGAADARPDGLLDAVGVAGQVDH